MFKIGGFIAFNIISASKITFSTCEFRYWNGLSKQVFVAKIVSATIFHHHTEAGLYHKASYNFIIIGSNNDLSPGRRLATTWTNGDLLSSQMLTYCPHKCWLIVLTNKSQTNLNLIEENPFGNVYKMVTILIKHQCVIQLLSLRRPTSFHSIVPVSLLPLRTTSV